ncbi:MULTISPECIES: flp operon protein C [Pasteurellaceae]|uniref:Flp operon protein C n=1 Tax=Pasteurella atlantica TaxID=2827233 RepID=A0AAW8CHY1_9PAST|nr:flp operon protein C [Pasteurella atlantica]MBR0573546.1 flp operon protein C [Pasteurella atlantica]MDP8039595.1 flp operon protein C [Pasteurella atlantica]MDP8041686.1 flp operon protein C [Pasteurella atlantica]MDP8043821.1 flp operon protein C [Pasteurella atlantica]MDP8045907.1 flp operon protein C [Pasteurella atlantica]
MNYRVLFIMSLFILFVGFAGLFFMPNSFSEQAPLPIKDSSQKIKDFVEDVSSKRQVIITATSNKDLNKGMLLKEEDYQLSEMTIEVKEGDDEPLLSHDLKLLFEKSKHNSLQGFLLNQNITKGSILAPKVLVSPDSSEFLISSIDPKQEVAYKVSVDINSDYILQTTKAGTYVSVYSYQGGVGRENQNRNDLIKVVDNVLVLQTNTIPKEEQDKNTRITGFVTLKMTAEQVKKLYTLPMGANLVLLPTDKPTPVDARGIFIRKLRG